MRAGGSEGLPGCHLELLKQTKKNTAPYKNNIYIYIYAHSQPSLPGHFPSALLAPATVQSSALFSPPPFPRWVFQAAASFTRNELAHALRKGPFQARSALRAFRVRRSAKPSDGAAQAPRDRDDLPMGAEIFEGRTLFFVLFRQGNGRVALFWFFELIPVFFFFLCRKRKTKKKAVWPFWGVPQNDIPRKGNSGLGRLNMAAFGSSIIKGFLQTCYGAMKRDRPSQNAWVRLRVSSNTRMPCDIFRWRHMLIPLA